MTPLASGGSTAERAGEVVGTLVGRRQEVPGPRLPGAVIVLDRAGASWL